MNKNVRNAIQDISRELHWIVADLGKYYGDEINEYSSLKIRYGATFNKFYLNRIEGSYDMSLQLLINFMLQDRHHYRKILSKETYKKVTTYNKVFPERLYDFSDNETEEKSVSEIEGILVCAVRNYLKIYGFSDKCFWDAGYDAESVLPHISPYYLVGDSIIYSSNSNGFLKDLKNYIKKHKLTQDDKNKIIDITKKSGENKKLATILFPEYSSLSDTLLKLVITECTKKVSVLNYHFK